MLPCEFDSQNYSVALEQGGAFVESVNQALLTVRKTEAWRRQVLAYLGK